MIATLTDSALSRVQAGDNAPVFRLEIAGENWSDLAADIEADFSDDSGKSELTFEAIGDLRPYVGERVVLWLGYGDKTIPYFAGELARPSEGSTFFTRKAKAIGPFSQMENREYMGEVVNGVFVGQVDFRGAYIGRALYDTASRMDFPSGTAEVVDPYGFKIDSQADEAIMVEEVNLQEGAETLMGFAEYVATDLPGSEYGMLRFQPRPRPGAGEKTIAVYGPDDYKENGFKVTRKEGGPYSEVIVFRRNPDGFYPVYQKAPIENRGLKNPPKDKPYRITDFAGDQAQARQTAYETARAIGAGEFGFTLDPTAINPDLYRYGQIQGWLYDERRDGTYKETYQCLIGGLKANVSAWEMPVSGDALLVDEIKVTRAVIDLGRLSVGGIPSSGLTLGAYGWDTTGLTPSENLVPSESLVPSDEVATRFWFNDGEVSYIGVDETGFWIDESLSGGLAGIDSTGLWFDD